MQVVTGKIISGQVVLDGATLPDGTAVTVFAKEAQTTVHLSPALQAELEAALQEADLEDGAAADEFLERLKQHG